MIFEFRQPPTGSFTRAAFSRRVAGKRFPDPLISECELRDAARFVNGTLLKMQRHPAFLFEAA